MSSSPLLPTVSIIIPVYNGEKYLQEAIESVLNQTYSNWELILVNDGSKDGSQKIINRFVKSDSRIKTIKQANGGQSAARNNGVQHSLGQYITFLDQDDRYYPSKLQEGVLFLDKHPEHGMVYSDLDVIDTEGRIITSSALTSNVAPIPKVAHPKKSIFDCLSGDMFILPGTTMIRRQIFQLAGGFDPQLSGYEDDDLYLRLFMTTKVGFMKESLIQWRIYSGSSSYSERMDTSRLRYAQKLINMFPDNPLLNVYWCRDVIVPRFCNTYLNSIFIARLNHNKQRVRKLLRDVEQLPNRSFKFKFIFFLLHPYIPLGIFKFFRMIYRKLYRI